MSQIIVTLFKFASAIEEDTEELNDKDLDSYPQKVVGAERANEYIEDSYKYYDIPNDPADITGGYLLIMKRYRRLFRSLKNRISDMNITKLRNL